MTDDEFDEILTESVASPASPVPTAVLTSCQERGLAALNSGRNVFITGEAGCLCGDTTVMYGRERHGSRPIKLERLYAKFNGLYQRVQRGGGAWDHAISTTLHSLFPDGAVRYNKVVAVYDSGKKETIVLSFSNGKKLTVTPDHPIHTPSGDFVHAGDLPIGGEVTHLGSMLPTGATGRSYSKRPPRVIINTKYHPHGGYKLVEGKYEYKRVARAVLVVEAALNQLGYDELVHILKTDSVRAATLRYIPRGEEVHHLDGNTMNDSLSNLVVLSKVAHATQHGAENEPNLKLEYTKPIKLVSCEPGGTRQTYDIQMESPANNFAANGVIVHNTGKSWLLTHWREQLPREKRVAITASTGVAALLIGGRTVHSFFGVGTGEDSLKDLIKNRKFSKAKERVQDTDILILEEVSMIGADLWSKIEAIARHDRSDDRPWGGMQVVALGDMGQLPPVNDEFCFLTAAWKSTRFLPILLRTQVRSQDAVYSRILRKVRYSEIDDEVINFLEERYNPHADDTWVRGLPRKRDVEAWNTRKLYDLGNEITTLRPITWGPDWAVKSLLSSLPVPAELSIAQDAYVMFRINHPEGLFANGTTGYIREIRREVLIVDLANASGKRSDNTIEVPRASFNLPDTGNRGDIAGVRQFPIQLAWAVTIHKLQGATLTHAAVDLGDLWEPGQAYVALSRVRKAEDVSVLGWSHKSFSSHPSVIKFYEIIEKLG